MRIAFIWLEMWSSECSGERVCVVNAEMGSYESWGICSLGEQSVAFVEGFRCL
jgi:hypothetical protein